MIYAKAANFNVQIQKKQNTPKIRFNQVIFSKQHRRTIINYIEALEGDQTGSTGNTGDFYREKTQSLGGDHFGREAPREFKAINVCIQMPTDLHLA